MSGTAPSVSGNAPALDGAPADGGNAPALPVAAPFDRLLARSHAVLGVGLLGGFLLYHLVRLWPALEGREAWVAANTDRGAHRTVAIGVLVLLLVHGVLGVMRVRRVSGSRLTRDERGLRAIQLGSGALVFAFVAYHVTTLWGLDAYPHGSGRALYALLWDTLGQPMQLGVYLLGVSLACFHFGHGLGRAVLAVGPTLPSPTRRLLVRVAAGVVGFALWALWLQVLAHFAIGQTLF